MRSVIVFLGLIKNLSSSTTFAPPNQPFFYRALVNLSSTLALDHHVLLLVGLYLAVIPVAILSFLFLHPNGLDALSLSSTKRKDL